MSNPRALRASARPTPPMPTMPSRAPVTCLPTRKAGDHESHAPDRTIRSPVTACRAAPSISIMASSAVASDSTPGVFVTAIPRALSAGRSQWSVPTEWFATILSRGSSFATTSAEKRSEWQGIIPSTRALIATISSGVPGVSSSFTITS
jgi:hypothetical protein